MKCFCLKNIHSNGYFSFPFSCAVNNILKLPCNGSLQSNAAICRSELEANLIFLNLDMVNCTRLFNVLSHLSTDGHTLFCYMGCKCCGLPFLRPVWNCQLHPPISIVVFLLDIRYKYAECLLQTRKILASQGPGK